MSKVKPLKSRQRCSSFKEPNYKKKQRKRKKQHSATNQELKLLDESYAKRPDDKASLEVLNFGKHKGKRYCEVPANYLQWLSFNVPIEAIVEKSAVELSRRWFRMNPTKKESMSLDEAKKHFRPSHAKRLKSKPSKKQSKVPTPIKTEFKCKSEGCENKVVSKDGECRFCQIKGKPKRQTKQYLCCVRCSNVDYVVAKGVLGCSKCGGRLEPATAIQKQAEKQRRREGKK